MRTNSTFGFSTDPDPPLGSVLAHVLHHEKEDEDSFAQPTRAKALRDSIPKTPTAEEEGRGFVAAISERREAIPGASRVDHKARNNAKKLPITSVFAASSSTTNSLCATFLPSLSSCRDCRRARNSARRIVLASTISAAADKRSATRSSCQVMSMEHVKRDRFRSKRDLLVRTYLPSVTKRDLLLPKETH